MKKLLNIIILLLITIINLPVFAIEQKKLTLVLDWIINPNHAPIFVAQQEGFFAKQGLEVTIISPADTSSGEKMVAAGKVDIAISYQPKVMQLVSRGLPVIRFATLIDKPLNCFITLDNGKITKIKDLKGKYIGLSTNNIDENVFLTTILDEANLSVKDIIPIHVKFNLIAALLTNKIDGFTGGMRNVEPLAIEILGKTTKIFYPEEHGFPEYDELIFITNKNKIDNPALPKFVYAIKQAIAFLKNNPDKAWQNFTLKHPVLNNVLNKKIWFTTLQYFPSDPAKLALKKYQTLTKFLWDKGLIKVMPKLEEYACELKHNID